MEQLGKLAQSLKLAPTLHLDMTVESPIRWPGSRSSPAGWPDRATALEPQRLAPVFDPQDFDPALRTQLLVLQSTPFCNIACDYCYLPDRQSSARMSLETVRLAARRLREDGLLGDELTVVWHCGEPMVLAPSWYEAAFAVLADELGPDCRCVQAMQTNAMLVDDAWCRLIQRHGVRLGVSIDGPQDLHDAHRRNRQGGGTHAQVMQGLQRLRDHGIDFHAIAVVTDRTLTELDRFVHFFESLGVQALGCNIDEAEGAHVASSLAGHEAMHAQWLQQLLQRTGVGLGPFGGTPAGTPAAAGAGTRAGRHMGVGAGVGAGVGLGADTVQRRLQVRELSTALQRVLEPLPTVRWRQRQWPLNTQALPLAIVSVAHDGRWSTFSPELLGQPDAGCDGFTFGRVQDGGYLAGARSPDFAHAWAAIADGVQQCEATCAYFGYCGGGAPANKFYENGRMDSGETLHCRLTVQQPFDLMLSHLEANGPGAVAGVVAGVAAGADSATAHPAPAATTPTSECHG